MKFLCRIIFLLAINLWRLSALEKYSNNGGASKNTFREVAQLLEVEKQLLKNFIFNFNSNSMPQVNQNKIKAIFKQLQVEHDNSKNNGEMYLTNVLHVFQLTRRMSVFWPQLLAHMNQTIELEIQTVAVFDELKAGLHNIQQIYTLKPADIAGGLLNGIQYDIKLSSYDCWLMAEYVLDLDYPKAALEWFQVAFDKYSELGSSIYDLLEFNLGNIYFGIARCLFELDRFSESEKLIQVAITYKPHDDDILKFENILTSLLRNGRGCRGEFSSASTRQRCSYNTQSSAFMRIAPLKVEQLLDDPYIVVYYDAIHDSEISDLKRLAISNLNRALVSPGIIDEHRTANSYNLPMNATKNLERLNLRIGEMTNFELESVFGIQVINYGIGGHFYNHFDFYQTVPVEEEWLGNRKAALMFYLSDVPQGGAVVFPKVNTAYHPKKGTAILWYHLDNAGNGNILSMHAGCPVLFGSKWIAIKMIYNTPQMFRKPCRIPQKSKIRIWEL